MNKTRSKCRNVRYDSIRVRSDFRQSHMKNPGKPNSIPAWRKPLDSFFSARPVTAVLKKTMPSLDRLLMRLSGGRFAMTQSLGMPTLLLTSTGRKSGLARTAPLLYVRDGEDMAIIGTNFGSTSYPAWYLNLMAQPDVTIQIRDRLVSVRARDLEGDERDRVWEKIVAQESGFAEYEQRTRGIRDIPVILFEPLRVFDSGNNSTDRS